MKINKVIVFKNLILNIAIKDIRLGLMKSTPVLFVFLFLIKFNTVHAQNVYFSYSSTDLNFLYETEFDFENEKLNPNAIELLIGPIAKRQRMLVSARAVSTFTSGSVAPTEIFTVQLNYSNVALKNTDYKRFLLTPFDNGILKPQNAGGNQDSIYRYNVIIAALGYDYDPGFYQYDLIFTLSQQ